MVESNIGALDNNNRVDKPMKLEDILAYYKLEFGLLEEEVFGDPPRFQDTIHGINPVFPWNHEMKDYKELIDDNNQGIVPLFALINGEKQQVDFPFQNKRGISLLPLLMVKNRTIASNPVYFKGRAWQLLLKNNGHGEIVLELKNLSPTVQDTPGEPEVRMLEEGEPELRTFEAGEHEEQTPQDEPSTIEDTTAQITSSPGYTVNPLISHWPSDIDKDDIISHDGVEWLSTAESGYFNILPSLSSDGKEYLILGFKTHSEYVGEDFMSQEIADELSYIFLNGNESRMIPGNNKNIFSLYKKIYGKTQWISRKIVDIDLADTSKITKNDAGWEYATTDKNGSPILLQLSLEDKAFTDDINEHTYVLNVDIIDIDYGSVLSKNQFRNRVGINFDDFFSEYQSIPSRLRNQFYTRASTRELKEWLNAIYSSMSDSIDSYVYNIERLDTDMEVEIGGMSAEFLERTINPVSNGNTAGLDKISMLPVDNQSIQFVIPSGPKNDNELFTINIPSLTETESYEQSFVIDGNKKIGDIPVSGEWKYELFVEEKQGFDGRMRKILRSALKPPVAYTEYFEEENVEIKSFNEVVSEHMVSPLDGGKFRVTSPFGKRRSGNHLGVDLALLSGINKKTPVKASFPGTVILARKYNDTLTDGAYGTYVVVQHEINGQKIRTVYAHLDADNLTVQAGDMINAGDKISTIEYRKGKQGRSTGPHLHFEMRVFDPKYKQGENHIHNQWRPVNPGPFLQ